MAIKQSIDLSPTLNLTEDHHGFWLWDDTRGMNLAMRSSTEQSAFVEALGYYQKRCAEVEEKLSVLSAKVDAFVSQFTEEED